MIKFIIRSNMNTVDYLYGKLRSYIQPYLPMKGTISEITPNIFLGDFAASCKYDLLKDYGITHVLCTINGVDPIFPSEFIYKNVHLRDNEHQNVMNVLDSCVKFIHDAIDCDANNNNKVFVHCACGISRSSTMVIAYLIQHHRQNYTDAVTYVKEQRPIVNPNNSFQQQLVNYDVTTNRRLPDGTMIKSCAF